MFDLQLGHPLLQLLRLQLGHLLLPLLRIGTCSTVGRPSLNSLGYSNCPLVDLPSNTYAEPVESPL